MVYMGVILIICLVFAWPVIALGLLLVRISFLATTTSAVACHYLPRDDWIRYRTIAPALTPGDLDDSPLVPTLRADT